MKTKCSKTRMTIVLPSDANKDLGLFLIFTGVVAVPPLYWLYYYYTNRSVHDWGPSILITAVFVMAGIFFICFSKKHIVVEKNQIRISDGFLKMPFSITWKGTPRVRLRYDEEERKGRIRDFWETSLLDGRLEYTIDRREHHQLESRALGENIARFLSCDLVEGDEDGKETVVAAEDLDLPFRQRVLKYSGFLRNPVEQPKHCILKIEERNKALLVSWGINSTGVVAETLTTIFFIALFTIFPWKQGERSFYQLCVLRDDFVVYYIAGALIALGIMAILGYRARLNLSRNGVIFWVTIWGVPLKVRKIMMSKIEEIHITPSMRGPRIQIVSDSQLISFRLMDRAAARWLSYRLQQYMIENGGDARPDSPSNSCT